MGNMLVEVILLYQGGCSLAFKLTVNSRFSEELFDGTSALLRGRLNPYRRPADEKVRDDHGHWSG